MTSHALTIDTTFATGDESVLRRAYNAHGPLVYTFCRRTVGPETAHDVTQEVFIAAWRARDRFDPSRCTLAGWLIGIAKNKVLDSLRRRQLRERHCTVNQIVLAGREWRGALERPAPAPGEPNRTPR